MEKPVCVVIGVGPKSWAAKPTHVTGSGRFGTFDDVPDEEFEKSAQVPRYWF